MWSDHGVARRFRILLDAIPWHIPVATTETGSLSTDGEKILLKDAK